MTHHLSGFDGAATVFVVQDVALSAKHYQSVLGFATEFTYGDPPVYAGVARDGVRIYLQSAAHTPRKPGHAQIYIFVEDVQSLFEDMQSTGANIVQEPKDYPYGMRDFDIRDLDGNQLTFGCETPSAAGTAPPKS